MWCVEGVVKVREWFDEGCQGAVPVGGAAAAGGAAAWYGAKGTHHCTPTVSIRIMRAAAKYAKYAGQRGLFLDWNDVIVPVRCGDFEWRRRRTLFSKMMMMWWNLKMGISNLSNLADFPKSTRTQSRRPWSNKQATRSDHGIQVPIQDCPPQPGEGEYTTLCCCLLLLKWCMQFLSALVSTIVHKKKISSLTWTVFFLHYNNSHQQRIYPAPSLTKYPKWNSISPPKFTDIVPKSHHLLLSGELSEQRQRRWCSIEKPGFTRWIFLSRRIRACFMRVERDEYIVMRN